MIAISDKSISIDSCQPANRHDEKAELELLMLDRKRLLLSDSRIESLEERIKKGKKKRKLSKNKNKSEDEDEVSIMKSDTIYQLLCWLLLGCV